MLLLAPSVSGLFKWRQFEPEVILLAVGWYLRFVLSYRDMEELLAERGFLVDHVTVWRWVQRYVPEMERRLRSRLKPTSDSWRVDSELHPVMGKWGYLYRCGEFFRRDHRFSPFCQAGRGCSKALPVQNVGAAAPSRAACHQHRRSQRVPACDRAAQS